MNYCKVSCPYVFSVLWKQLHVEKSSTEHAWGHSSMGNLIRWADFATSVTFIKLTCTAMVRHLLYRPYSQA